MVVIFCAFGAEYGPLRARLRNAVPLDQPGLRGCSGDFGGVPVTIVVSGVGIRRAGQTAALALEHLPQVDRVILTGVAGALHSDLQVGDVVIGDRLLMRRGQEFAIEHAVAIANEDLEAIAATLGAARITHTRGAILTSRRAIAMAVDKQRAHQTLGAIAVDMESAAIARELQLRQIPFVSLRTILDTAAQDLEGAMLADENGRIRPLAVASALARNPGLILASMRLMKNLRLATRTMATAVTTVVASRVVSD